MSDFQPVVLSKGDDVRIANSPREQVRLVFDGYQLDGEAPEVEKYDPADHTVDEVQAYADGVDQAERERVIAAEAVGKNRVTLVSSLQAAGAENAS